MREFDPIHWTATCVFRLQVLSGVPGAVIPGSVALHITLKLGCKTPETFIGRIRKSGDHALPLLVDFTEVFDPAKLENHG